MGLRRTSSECGMKKYSKQTGIKRPEILSPAGDIEKMRFAFKYGADAVYISGKNYGLRSFAGNFSDEELKEAVKSAHAQEKKVYVTVNIFPYNSDIDGIKIHLEFLKSIQADGLIVSDLGVFRLAQKYAAGMPVHISVQANNLNYEEVKAWKELGAKRIILARELSISEIKEIRGKVPGIELEIFVHGAVCMSYSGRCLLSNYLTGRDANRGECAQACRWSYRLMEEKRPEEYLPVIEDERGTYILNAKDLNLIGRIKELAEAGIDSFKIEGRMKGFHYIAATASAYRAAAEKYAENPENYEYDPAWGKELNKISHRKYTEGFYFKGDKPEQNFTSSEYISDYKYLGYVKQAEGNIIKAEIKNSFKTGETVEILVPPGKYSDVKILSIKDSEGIEETYVKQDKCYTIEVETKENITPYSILRKKN